MPRTYYYKISTEEIKAMDKALDLQNKNTVFEYFSTELYTTRNSNRTSNGRIMIVTSGSHVGNDIIVQNLASLLFKDPNLCINYSYVKHFGKLYSAITSSTYSGDCVEKNIKREILSGGEWRKLTIEDK